jgi:hypothetical protein
MRKSKIINPNIHPQRWCTGPDLRTHRQYRAYVSQRNQALYRSEGWTITFEEFQLLWATQWEQRGREQDQVLLTRRDPEQPWTVANVEIITRRAHAQRQGVLRAAGWRSKARARALQNVSEQSD